MSGDSARPLASNGPRAPRCPEPPPSASPRQAARDPPRLPPPRHGEQRLFPPPALGAWGGSVGPGPVPGAPTHPSVLAWSSAKGLGAGVCVCVRPRFPAPHAGAVTFCRSAASAAGSRGPVCGSRRGLEGRQSPSLPAAGPQSGLSQIAVTRTWERKRWSEQKV